MSAGRFLTTHVGSLPRQDDLIALMFAREEGLPRLSMGMSGDYETAIMLGATDIRVGTALFGERPAPARPVPASGRGMIRNSGGS